MQTRNSIHPPPIDRCDMPLPHAIRDRRSHRLAAFLERLYAVTERRTRDGSRDPRVITRFPSGTFMLSSTCPAGHILVGLERCRCRQAGASIVSNPKTASFGAPFTNKPIEAHAQHDTFLGGRIYTSPVLLYVPAPPCPVDLVMTNIRASLVKSRETTAYSHPQKVIWQLAESRVTPLLEALPPFSTGNGPLCGAEFHTGRDGRLRRR